MHFSPIHFLTSVLEVCWIKNQLSTKTLKKCETMSSTLSDLSESGKLLKITSLTGTLSVLSETRSKCIGNCPTANVLCKQFRTRWWQGSCYISSEKGKIMEGFKKLLKKCWGDSWDDWSSFVYKPTKKLPWDWLDTWCAVCFICFS